MENIYMEMWNNLKRQAENNMHITFKQEITYHDILNVMNAYEEANSEEIGKIIKQKIEEENKNKKQ